MALVTTSSIILGGGCFWCLEALFRRVHGVTEVISGYAGGTVVNPTYDQVSTGTTGHAEVILVRYLEQTVTLETLLTVFFHLHDPTTKNRQGADIGTQYRSIIICPNPEAMAVARKIFDQVTKEKVWEQPLTTEITTQQTFYPAERYHQQYFENNANQPYCAFTIGPKIQKLRTKFPALFQDPAT